ncbi:DUF4474 domain-containing protein [Schnuerera sp. xch1]|uniref:DUF4474 domain-containing protein n=1 Tax=Schnuerera sp. xch1 TaxID=2874283 RepID=UPI001CBAA97B|nr:DUF4474 domain-containing protein [Schnuerera sp. xch1]MBZ2173950.1 DUF4474 domain-containing protein [Schnuerera sp. xch1]
MFEFIQNNIYLIFLIVVLISIVYIIILKRSKFKVKEGNTKIKDVESLNEFLRPYGYAYDSHQDIFYSRIDAWQREKGYTKLYDEAAAPSSMIIDCEPIYFEYGNKRWMIEFWKGQYGMTTGFEIGVFHTDKPDLINEYFNWTFYDCADDDNMLKMKFTLTKNGKTMMKRKGIHWWLTGFKLGEFSQPWELVANISIALKDLKMRDAFLQGLQRAGYKREELLVKDKTVRLTFDKPKTPQPFTRIDEFDKITQKKNKLLCDNFNELTKDYDNALDKIIALQEIAPDMLKSVLLMGKTKDIFS